jgi:integron integrase
MGGAEVQIFLFYLVNERNVAGATYTQALCAILFLYKKTLKIDVPWIEGIQRPKEPAKRPTVLTSQEIERIFSKMEGVYALIARLLYGTGMRLMECAQLRVKDVDFQRREITIREGKGGKDRLTMLPLALIAPLREQLARSKIVHSDDRQQRRSGVMLPNALELKYPAAGTHWGWLWVFPSDHESTDPRSGVVRRHHIYEQSIQRSVKRAVAAAKLIKPATCHTFRHSFATQGFRARGRHKPAA